MKLKTLVKHLIMQWPSIFPNALAVYDHLFYVIGNGSYGWKNGRKARYTKDVECVKISW